MQTKQATSLGSALPDPVKSQAAASPMPIPVMENKTAPGQTGPRGLSPRTSYSRVNAAPPPVSPLPDGPKMSPARGAEFLPAKTAHAEGIMTTPRPTLHELVKAAMEGTIEKVDINNEAARQIAGHRGHEPIAKVASVSSEHYSSEHIEKMAAALDFISEQVKTATPGPGVGPGALTVEHATSAGTVLEAGQSGESIPRFQLPTNTSTQAEQVQAGKANTGMETNDDMMHGEQPISPIVNQTAPLGGKTASALFNSNLRRLGLVKSAAKALEVPGEDSKNRHPWGTAGGGLLGMGTGAALANKYVPGSDAAALGGGLFGGALGMTGAKRLLHIIDGEGAGGEKAASGKKSVNLEGPKAIGKGVQKAGKDYLGVVGGKHKKAGAPVGLIRKLAEDALNPAQISAGKAVPPDASESGQDVPPQPSDVRSQANSMLGSNDAAINYTKGQAKADPKHDVNQVLAQPALTRAGDSVLHEAFDNTERAGVKISSPRTLNDPIKVASARALLSNLMDKVAEEKGTKKKKESMMGTAPSSPSAASGFTSSSLG